MIFKQTRFRFFTEVSKKYIIILSYLVVSTSMSGWFMNYATHRLQNGTQYQFGGGRLCTWPSKFIERNKIIMRISYVSKPINGNLAPFLQTYQNNRSFHGTAIICVIEYKKKTKEILFKLPCFMYFFKIG